LFIIQGPFSVAPCQTLVSRFATFSSLYGRPVRFDGGRTSTCAVSLTAAQLETFCAGDGRATLGAPEENGGVLAASPPLPLQLLKGLLYQVRLCRHRFPLPMTWQRRRRSRCSCSRGCCTR
jgi:hypothetical protein